jgi:hypothetical protein
MRSYDYQLFGNMVKAYFWPNHQVPPLSDIFVICGDMLQFLLSTASVIKETHSMLLLCIAIMGREELAPPLLLFFSLRGCLTLLMRHLLSITKKGSVLKPMGLINHARKGT